MKSSDNLNSIDYVKRSAKQIKKELKIPHHQALDMAAKAVGFAGWRHFLNVKSSLDVAPTVVAKTIPTPVTKSFNVMFTRGKFRRPNCRMPLTAHREVASLLDEALAIFHEYKSAYKPVDSVRSELDEWVQKEYTSREEMSDEEFHDLYYAHKNQPVFDRDVSPQEIKKCVDNLQCVKKILSGYYHECAPLTQLFKKIDRGIAALDKWSGVIARIGKASRQLTRGTFVRVKPNRCDAIVVSHDVDRNTVEVFEDSGPCTCSREQVSVYRNQPKELHKPMRLYLPYGKWIRENGSEVLFNRDYKPMWERKSTGEVVSVNPDEWVSNKEQIYFFDDGNPPWRSKKTVAKCLNILHEWGVGDKNPQTMQSYYKLIETGKKEKSY